MDIWMDGQMNGKKHGWMQEWTNGQGIVFVMEEVSSQTGQGRRHKVSMGDMKF